MQIAVGVSFYFYFCFLYLGVIKEFFTFWPKSEDSSFYSSLLGPKVRISLVGPKVKNSLITPNYSYKFCPFSAKIFVFIALYCSNLHQFIFSAWQRAVIVISLIQTLCRQKYIFHRISVFAIISTCLKTKFFLQLK